LQSPPATLFYLGMFSEAVVLVAAASLLVILIGG
jgi:hypothetical protein